MTEHLAARTRLPPDDERIYLATSYGLFALSVSYGRWTERTDGAGPLDEFVRTVEVLRGLLDDEITLG